ncbi:MAG: hypothetical protein U0871_12040 [Gemmataceae bacterium]
MSRLLSRPTLPEDEFARKFRTGPSANPLADALERPIVTAYQPPAAADVARTAMATSPHAAQDRATAGGDDSTYLPPALRASGGRYGRPLAPIPVAPVLPAGGPAPKPFDEPAATPEPVYAPPGPEAAARTAMAASPAHAAIGGAAITGGRVADRAGRSITDAEAVARLRSLDAQTVQAGGGDFPGQLLAAFTAPVQSRRPDRPSPPRPAGRATRP